MSTDQLNTLVWLVLWLFPWLELIIEVSCYQQIQIRSYFQSTSPILTIKWGNGDQEQWLIFESESPCMLLIDTY